MEREGKSAESKAVTWSTLRVVMRYVAVIVLTRPTLGNAATTVPPFMSTFLNSRTSIVAMGPPSAGTGRAGPKYVCEGRFGGPSSLVGMRHISPRGHRLIGISR